MKFPALADDKGQTGFPDPQHLHQAVESHEIDGGPQHPALAAVAQLRGNNKMGQAPQSEKNIADRVWFRKGFPKPGGISVAGLGQLKGSGIGDLQPRLVHQAHVHENPPVFFLQHPQHPSKKSLVLEFFQRIGRRQDLYVRHLFHEKRVDVLGVALHKFTQMVHHFMLIGRMELISGNGRNHQQGRNGYHYDNGEDMTLQCAVVVAAARLLSHKGSFVFVATACMAAGEIRFVKAPIATLVPTGSSALGEGLHIEITLLFGNQDLK